MRLTVRRIKKPPQRAIYTAASQRTAPPKGGAVRASMSFGSTQMTLVRGRSPLKTPGLRNASHRETYFMDIEQNYLSLIRDIHHSIMSNTAVELLDSEHKRFRSFRPIYKKSIMSLNS